MIRQMQNGEVRQKRSAKPTKYAFSRSRLSSGVRSSRLGLAIYTVVPVQKDNPNQTGASSDLSPVSSEQSE